MRCVRFCTHPTNSLDIIELRLTRVEASLTRFYRISTFNGLHLQDSTVGQLSAER